MGQVKYSVVVPVYRGELTLRKLAKELIFFFNSERFSFELIFVDDFAPDKSWDIIKSIKKDHEEVIRGIRLSGNSGQHNALKCGILNATGEYIITMDEDLQHSPYDIIKLIMKQKESDYDLVYGSFRKLSHNKFRNLTSRVLKKLLRVGLPGLHPDYSPFRLIKSKVAREALSGKTSYGFIDAYLSLSRSKTASVEVIHSKRYAGRSSYNLRKLISHSINIFINFSVPLIRVLAWSFLILILLLAISGTLVVLQNVYHKIFASGQHSIYNICMILFLLIIFITVVIYLASMVWSILRNKKNSFSINEII